MFCREAPPEFTPQQRDVFCVFSGEGVSRLRDFLNHSTFRENNSITMYDDAEEVDEDEGNATEVPHTHGGQTGASGEAQQT